MRKISQIVIAITVIAVVSMVLFGTDAEAQCAMCKASIESSVKSGQPSPGAGINEGILYIMGIPYLLIAAAGFFIYRHMKQLDREPV